MTSFKFMNLKLKVELQYANHKYVFLRGLLRFDKTMHGTVLRAVNIVLNKHEKEQHPSLVLYKPPGVIST